jgi:UDPglucose 6-dehydrogenase
VKYATRFFLALRLSYINMIAEIAENVGANIREVIEGFGRDPIVGFAYNPETESDYLRPGLGWGGHQLSKALAQMKVLAAEWIPDRVPRPGKWRSEFI